MNITIGAFILFVCADREDFLMIYMVNSKNNIKKINYISYTSVTRGAFGKRVSDNVRRDISEIFFLFLASIC